MTEDLREQFNTLLFEAWDAGDNDTGFALAQEAVRLADLINDRDLQWDAREQLVNTATFSGHPREALVAFSWMLAACDNDPDWHSDVELMWSYKWIAGDLCDHPEFSREQIAATLNDMERRYLANGLSLKAVYKLRFDTAWAMGDPAEWRRYYELWNDAPDDGSEDCAACEQDDLVEHALNLNEPARALELAAPVLQGRMSCKSVPHRTLARLLRPTREIDRLDEAEEMAKRLARLIGRDAAYVHLVGRLLEHYAATGNTTGGLRLLEKSLPWLADHATPDDEFRYWLGARQLLASARAGARAKTRKLRIPATIGFHRADSAYKFDDVINWVDARMNEIAASFDDRNGNDYYTRRANEART